mgnify:CR=1 FL=1
MMNRKAKNYLLAGLLAAIVFFVPDSTPAQIIYKPENFWEYSVTRIKEGGDDVDIMIGGFRKKEFSYIDRDGITHYKITKIDRSDEIWKWNRDTGEWVQLKPYDETWLKVPRMAGHQALQNKLDGFIYCFGGRSANGDSAVYMLNLKTGQWRQLAFHPFYDHEKMAASANFTPFTEGSKKLTGRAVFHGGINNNGVLSNMLYQADIAEEEIFFTAKETPRALYGHAAIYDQHADTWHFWGGQNENGINFENYQYNSKTGFGWGPPIQGPFVMPRASAATCLDGSTLYAWGGKGYTFLRKGVHAAGEEIRTDLISITARNGQLYSRIIATGLPPVSQAALSMDISNGDTLFYVIGGISTIWSNGDTTVNNNAFRYNLTQKTVQQFDTTSMQWGRLQTTVVENHFPVSPELHIDVPVHPNPSQGMITFTLKEGLFAESLKLYNQLGQMVMQVQRPGAQRMDLSRFAPGIYYLRVDTKLKPCFARIVKN